MSLVSQSGNLTIVSGGANSVPTMYWNGEQLLHVVAVHYKFTPNDTDVRIRVQDPAGHQNGIYAQMAEAGVVIKRKGSL